MNSTELKEAIAEYIKSKELVLMGYSPEYIDDVKTDMEIAFRAGAEWMASREEQEQPEVENLKNKAELIANEIMMGVQANKYHTCIYNKASNDFNHSHLMRAALKGIELGLNARKEE